MDYVTISLALKTALTVVVFSTVLQLLRIVVWRPHAVTKWFKKQGVEGPPYSLLRGNLDEINHFKEEGNRIILHPHSNHIFKRVLPHYYIWSSKYGETFLYWHGTDPHLCISDVELAKQILSNKSGVYRKLRPRPLIEAMIGKGLVLVDGEDWVRHKRIVHPALTMDKLKVMAKTMVECSISQLEEWKRRAEFGEDGSAKIEMNHEFQKLTADIIARTAFGSSYMDGREAFEAQRQLQNLHAASEDSIFIPGSQYLPTPSNLQRWKLEKKMNGSLSRIIESRLKSKNSECPDFPYGDDVLGVMMAAMEPSHDDYHESKLGQVKPLIRLDEIIEECKTFFIAGHDTTANLLTWTMLMLSIHQDWQTKLREEVLEECGMRVPDADMLAKLKLVNMVLLEVLRLYSPVAMMLRETSEDTKLGNLMIPKHTIVTIPIIMIHRRKDYWGEDANEFKPLRFMNGISRAAKHPNALMGFSMGPRACIGQNFAMMEAKAVLALILQRFSFSLSPDYKHAPIEYLTLQTQYGLPIIVKPLN